ncbi:MAG TPA: hypothetical protein VGL81_36225 [Polyangiaceae bacterium]|jgi:hypothetical protein
MAFPARAALLTALLGLFPVAALAQATPPTDPAAQAAPATTDTAAPAASSAAPAFPATGYGWSTTPKRHTGGHGRPHAPLARARSRTPDAILPGFETLADGSTRLFVLMSQPVQYEVKPARGTLTYVLKGAHVDKRNNYNPLVTVHFNTPVTTARLVPHGKDLWFVIDLRAQTTPTVTMDAAKDGGSMLRIEFPKGDYLPAGMAPPPPAIEPAPPPTTGSGPAPAPPPAAAH